MAATEAPRQQLWTEQRLLRCASCLRSNDAVLISFAQALLHEAGSQLCCRSAHERGRGLHRRLSAPASGRCRRDLAAARRAARPTPAWRYGSSATARPARERRRICSRRPPAATRPTMRSSAARCTSCSRRQGYRAGLDARAAGRSRAVRGEDERVLDVGAGVGVVGLAVARRLSGRAGRRWSSAMPRSPRWRAAISSATAWPSACALIEADVTRPLERACRSSLRGAEASTTCWPIRPITSRGAARCRRSRARPPPTPCRRALSTAGCASWRAMARPGGTRHPHPSGRGAAARSWPRSTGASVARVVLPLHPRAASRPPRPRAGHQGQPRAAGAAARARPAQRRSRLPARGRAILRGGAPIDAFGAQRRRS